MDESVDLALVLKMAVNFLLLLGTNRLSGYPIGVGRSAMAAAAGYVFTAVSLLPGFHFLDHFLWRGLVMVLICMIAFGTDRNLLHRGTLFILLSMALCGVTVGISRGGFWGAVAAGAGLSLLWLIGFPGNGAGNLVNVELSNGDTNLHLTGLRDTGNLLRDPITGQQVLVTGPEVANALTGLTKEQLRDPVKTLSGCKIPGLRLIPYRTVGQENGLLLAVRIPKVRIGSWRGSSLVAFAAEGLSMDGTYQILTGGSV